MPPASGNVEAIGRRPASDGAFMLKRSAWCRSTCLLSGVVYLVLGVNLSAVGVLGEQMGVGFVQDGGAVSELLRDVERLSPVGQ